MEHWFAIWNRKKSLSPKLKQGRLWMEWQGFAPSSENSNTCDATHELFWLPSSLPLQKLKNFAHLVVCRLPKYQRHNGLSQLGLIFRPTESPRGERMASMRSKQWSQLWRLLCCEWERRRFGLSKPWAARRGTPILQRAYLALHTSNTTSAYLRPLAAYLKPPAAYNKI